MLELLQKNKGLALLVFGAATQLAGILMYAQNMITDILKEEIERLEGDIKVIEQSLFR